MARIYRPAAAIKLFIRLDDFNEPTDVNVVSERNAFNARYTRLEHERTRVGLKLTQAYSENNGVQVNFLSQERDKLDREIAQLKGKGKVQPQVLGDIYSIELVVIPTDLSVELNSFRIADTVKASFPFRDAPFPQDIIRAVLIEVYMGTVPAADFANPSRWQLPIDRSTLMFRGYADEWEDGHGDDDTITISARSMECLLIDTKVAPAGVPRAKKGSNEKVTAWINRFMGTIPAVAGGQGGDYLTAQLSNRIDPKTEPLIDTKLLNIALQTAKSRNAANGSVNGQPPEVDALTDAPDLLPGGTEGTGEARMPVVSTGEMAAWDIIVAVCELCGLLPIYDAALAPNNIILQTGQTLYPDVQDGIKVPGGAPDGFSRQMTDTHGRLQTNQVRIMVWGHNIKSMKRKRKLGRIKMPTVQVISFNPDAGAKERRIVATYPPTKRPTKVGAKGGGKSEEVITRVVWGVRNKEILQQQAVSLYHQIARNEVSVLIETDDMSSYIDPAFKFSHDNQRGENGVGLDSTRDLGQENIDAALQEADLLRLRAGSPVSLKVAVQDVRAPEKRLLVNNLSDIYGRRGAELEAFLNRRVDQLEKQLTGTDIAIIRNSYKRIADALQSAKLLDVFYCRAVRHTFNIAEGWSAEIELANYMRVRGDPASIGAADEKINNERKRFKPNAIDAYAAQKALEATAADIDQTFGYDVD